MNAVMDNIEAMLRISTDGDVIAARQRGRQVAEELGFSRAEQALIATAISELARNIIRYAGEGGMTIGRAGGGGATGIRVVAEDTGPGIEDVDAALQDGFSTGNSLGLGLPGTRRIVDEFRLSSTRGKGTTVEFVKYLA